MPTVSGVAWAAVQAQGITPPSPTDRATQVAVPGESLETGMEILSSRGHVRANWGTARCLEPAAPECRVEVSCHNGHAGEEVTSTKVVCPVAEASTADATAGPKAQPHCLLARLLTLSLSPPPEGAGGAGLHLRAPREDETRRSV